MSRLIRKEITTVETYVYDDSPVEPTDPPIEPTDPTEPTEPTEPTDPTDPPPPPAEGDIVYVSPAGSDSNPGTIDQPRKYPDRFEGNNDVPNKTYILMDGVHVWPVDSYGTGMYLKSNGMTLKAQNRRQAIVKLVGEGRNGADSNKFFSNEGDRVTIEGIVFDGDWHGKGFVAKANNTGLKIVDCEWKNFTRHVIDTTYCHDATIKDCSIHDILWWDGFERKDAHGISGTKCSNLLIEGCEIYSVSGDCIQMQDKSYAITVRDCELYNPPITAEQSALSGFPEGVRPGENAIDTKQRGDLAYQFWTIHGVTAHGWHSDLIGNAAAFNLKENVEVTATNVHVYDCDIAWRCRGDTSNGGPAIVTVSQSNTHNCNRAVRYEDGIGDKLKFDHCTFGPDVATYFEKAPRSSTGTPVVTNSRFYGDLPAEAVAGIGNMVVQ